MVHTMHRAAIAARTAARTAAVAAVLVLAGCIVLPRTAEVYDPKCRTYVKQIVLETEVIGAIGGCRNDGCAVMLASMGIVSAASLVISGSVAIIGNVVHWAERQGGCPAEPAAASPPAAAPAAASAVALPRPPVVPGLVPGPVPLPKETR